MSVPAHARKAASESWTEEDWNAALDARPDLLDRLNDGESEVLAEMLELMPDVSVKSMRVREEDPPAHSA